MKTIHFIAITNRLIASLFVDQIRLFLNEAVRSPGTTASVSRILPPKFALMIMAFLRVSNPVPEKRFNNNIIAQIKSFLRFKSHYLQSHSKLWLNYRHHFRPFSCIHAANFFTTKFQSSLIVAFVCFLFIFWQLTIASGIWYCQMT